jgi:hypothetical protein
MQVTSGGLVRKRDDLRGTVGVRDTGREISARVITYSFAVTAEENRKSWQVRSKSRNLGRVYASSARYSGLKSPVNNNRPALMAARSHTRAKALVRDPALRTRPWHNGVFPVAQSIILGKMYTNLRHRS